MHNRLLSLALLCLALPLTSLAESADHTFYMQSCGACHGPDGKGTGGAFPPLAESEWLKGSSERAIQVVLHGLTGPVTVKGKTYNLVMPPQGGSMSDDQIASVLSYIRHSFGNKQDAITAAQVKKARATTAKRETPWTEKEILKLYPLPQPKPILENLVSRLYHGTFPSPGSMRRSKVIAVEEEKSGLIDVNNVERKDNYGMSFTADLKIEKTGTYEFLLDADDSADIYIDRQRIVRVLGKGAMNGSRKKKGNILLTPGTYKFLLEYVEYTGHSGVSIEFKGPGIPKGTFLTKAKSASKGRTWPSIPIVAPEGETVIYRNFISGSTARGIGVGYSEGVNQVFSADTFNSELIWTGKFIDGGRHWTERGQGREAPAGDGVAKLSSGPAFARLNKASDAWPKNYSKASQARFLGYKLESKTRRPIFAYEVSESLITDRYTPEAGSLTRFVSINSQLDPSKATPMQFRPVHGIAIKDLGNGKYGLGERLTLSISGKDIKSSIIGKSLIVTFPKIKGRSSATLTYQWN